MLSAIRRTVVDIVGLFVFASLLAAPALMFLVATCEAQPALEKKKPSPPVVECPFAATPAKPEDQKSRPFGALRSGSRIAPTEQAINRALDWLAEHQLADGSWNTDFQKCPACNGKCKNSGTLDAIGGTRFNAPSRTISQTPRRRICDLVTLLNEEGHLDGKHGQFVRPGASTTRYLMPVLYSYYGSRTPSEHAGGMAH